MVNNRPRRRRTRRVRRRRGIGGNVIPSTRIEPARNRIARYPPSLSMNSNLCSIWMRSEYQWSSSSTEKEMSLSYNIKNAADELGILNIFTEYRVKRINFWYVPKNSIKDAGLNAMAVLDHDEGPIGAVPFAQVASLPGSDTRRVYQTLAAAWFPTEPDDRNWSVITDTPFCNLYLATSRDKAGENMPGPLSGICIADAHLSFRGINTKPKLELVQHAERSAFNQCLIA